MIDDAAFCDRCVMEAGVASIPFSAFYAKDAETRFVRFCFTKPVEMLDEAVERLAQFRRKLVD